MRVSLTFMGLDLLSLEISTDAEPDEADDEDAALSGGNTTSLALGFTPQPGDQRWEQGTEQ